MSIRTLCLILSLAAAAACSDDDGTGVQLNQYEIVSQAAAVGVGQDSSVELAVRVRNVTENRDVSTAPVFYSSADTTIATVSATGLVRAVRGGQTNVHTVYRRDTLTTRVTVRPYPVASVTLTPDELTIARGATFQPDALVATATGDTLYCNKCSATVGGQPRILRGVTWTSTNTARATVSANGTISVPTAATAGTVSIILRVPVDQRADTAVVTVP